MKCSWLSMVVAGVTFSLPFALGTLPGHAEKKAEKPKDILGKSIGEWIMILREHENPNFRRAALKALEYDNAAARVGLAAILDAAEKDKDAQVRRDAIMLVGRLGPETKGAMKVLANALNTDKADLVREAAATAIGKKFTEPAQEFVTDLADALKKDPHVGTRIAVAATLREMGKHARPAVPTLLESARKSDEHALVRREAIHIISRQGKDNAQTFPLLVELLLNEQNPATVREAAADALAFSGGEPAAVIAALGKTLADKNLEVRKAASVSLNALRGNSKAAWPAIKARLTGTVESDSSIRNHLIRLAGVLGKDNADVIVVLTDRASEDESTENRLAAIQELGELGPLARSALPVLMRLVRSDARAAIRDTADKAVKQINP